jgi:SPP1 gp7 family putative phage head morphogenesis protein
VARSLDDTGKYLIQILRRGGQAANGVEVLLFDGRNKIIQKVIKGLAAGASQAQLTGLIHKEVSSLGKSVDSTLTKHGVEAGAAEAQSSAAYLSALGVADPKPIKLSKAYVRRAFNIPFPDQKITVNNLMTGTMANMDVSLVNVTRDAIVRNDPIRSTAKFIERSSGQLVDASLRRKANALARTAIMQVSNQVRADSFKEEPEVSGVLYVATLDHRTSNICKSLDGKFWTDKKKARVPPLHVSCRSSLAPVLKGETLADVKDQLNRPAVEVKSVQQLEEKGLRTRNNRIRKPSKTDASPLKGVVKSKYVTYEQWIKQQPVAYQKSILGTRAQAELARTGDLNKALGLTE